MFRRWQGEPEDPDWTHAARDSLGDVAERNQLGPEVIQDVSCKRTICRIELQFSKLADAAGFAELAGDPSAFDVMDLTPNLSAAADLDIPSTPEPGVRGVAPARHYLVYLARPGGRIADVVQDGS